VTSPKGVLAETSSPKGADGQASDEPPMPEDDPDLDHPRLQHAFRRFKMQDSSDLDVNDLLEVLHYLCLIRTEKEQVLEIVHQVISYEYMDYDEFLSFMQKYMWLEKDRCSAEFQQLAEGGEKLSNARLRRLLSNLGYLPCRNMVREALQQIGKTMDDFLTFSELLQFLAGFRRTETFPKEEVEALEGAFQSQAAKDGKLDAKNITDAMVHFYGVHVTEHAQVLQAQLEAGHIMPVTEGSTTGLQPQRLKFSEFLIFARKLREKVFELTCRDYPDWTHIGRSETPPEKARHVIDMAMLRRALQSMRYTPLMQNVNEVLEQVLYGARPEPLELDFNQFFEFLLVVRQREGFLAEAAEEMKKVFERFDDSGEGEVDALELADIFRHLGYAANLDDIHVFVLEVDSNGSNQLDFREFLRLMRLHRESELARIKQSFDRNVARGSSILSKAATYDALAQLGSEPPAVLKEMKEQLAAGIDFDAFVSIVDACRGELVLKQRKHAGFPEERVEELFVHFQRYDKDHSGALDTLELNEVLRLNGWQPKSAKEQKALLEKLNFARANAREAGIEDVGKDGTLQICFWTFVQLARILETEQQRRAEQEIKDLMEELTFTPHEVDEFRQVFVDRKKDSEQELSTERRSKEVEGISAGSVRRLIRTLVTRISAEDKAELDKKLDDLMDGSELLDFPGFLRLMRWLLDSGLAGGNGNSSAKK